MLTVKALAEAAKDYDASGKAQFGLIGAIVVIGAGALLILLIVILLAEGGFKSPSTVSNLASGTLFLVYLGYTGMMIAPGLAATMAQSSMNRRR